MYDLHTTPFSNPAPGSFVLIDEGRARTLAAGVIRIMAHRDCAAP